MSYKNPLVSIIIPTYNRAHIISETLDSIISQTYTNWECIVVDDGSTDNSSKILANYCKKDSRIKYHHRPINRHKGGNAARNYGFELSKGEYIQWFDSDDLMLSEKLEIQLNDLKSGNFNFSITQTRQINASTGEEKRLISENLESDNIIEDFINFKCFWLLQNVLWKKEYLNFNKLRLNENLYQAQDYEFHLNVLKTNYKYIPNYIITTHMILHKENMSNSTIDSPLKIYSNALVQKKIIMEFNKLISKQTLDNSYQLLLNCYSNSLRQRQFKNSILILMLLIKCGKKIKFKVGIVRLTKGFIYLFTGVGYKWTKNTIG